MRDYGKVFSKIWESPTFRALTEDGRTLALYLLTCSHGTLIGAFRIPDGYVCEDLQWGSERVAEGFLDLSVKGFATRDLASKWVWIAKHLEWNPLENPNQRIAAKKIALQIPAECAWKPEFMRVCGLFDAGELAQKEEGLAKGSETLSKPVTVTVVIPPNPPRGAEEVKPRKAKKPSGLDPEQQERFDRFWASYPRRTAREAAISAFLAINPDDGLLEVWVAAIAAQCLQHRCDTGDDKHVPHPATWLNGKRWLDETRPRVVYANQVAL